MILQNPALGPETSGVPAGMLNCCAQAGLAAISGCVGSQSSSDCVPSQGRKVQLQSLISIGILPD